ncbi:metallophosphoesterase [Waterburya agarophytonicola K14]|uniref:Metallophosphoesterase n=1 Tax=Waterburya agarophytonicola KI4 TaxID=2874699 RepID=A0A964BTL7_9CYAN|nr:metallophosphoesterase [Waterburya agarophytonicola]MCC0177620.1 metallophosphoesterase [Waterburya agarophytonicola KI4]
MVAIRYPNLFKTIRKWISKITVAILILLVNLYIYSSKIEPNWIEIVPINLTIPNLSPAFNDFKIVQISDLHTSQFMPDQRLNKIIELVNQQNSDAIAITGDIITKRRSFDAKKLRENLSKLVSKDGTFSVLGNHDHWGKQTNRLKKTLKKSNINNLDNQVYVIKRGSEKLAIAGIDDPYWGQPDLERVIERLPDSTPAILLVHEPDYIETSAKTYKFDLQLSGHSHGGQIRLPFFDPLVLPPGGRKYFIGLNRVEDTLEYTNRGLGMTGLSFRFNSRPEITVFTLHSTSY